MAELAGEKIDVIPWSDDPAVFVANALSPAQVLSVDIDEEKRIASVTVPERMLSLAIGREGQNARLAARLTGWRIDIRSDVSVAEAKAAAEAEATQPVAIDSGSAEGAAAAMPQPRPTAAAAQRPRKPRRRSRSASPRRLPPRRPLPSAATTESTDGVAVEAPAKPKRATKKAAAAASTDTNDGVAKAAPATEAPATEPAEEVAP